MSKLQGEMAGLYREYIEKYDLSGATANDKENLESMVRNSVIIRRMQDELNNLLESNSIAEFLEQITDLSTNISKLQKTQSDLERQLGIDRKSRKVDDDVSPHEYLYMIKRAAQDFMEKRLIKVFCPDCGVMLGRISPVHEHTAYSAYFQCSQCKQFATIRRVEKDVFFDLAANDRDWRKGFPVAIKHPKKKKGGTIEDIEDEYIVGDE